MQVRVENVSKRYVGIAALDDVSLTVQSGELVALLGPSGSGKTTLLRTIAGLEHADAGTVYFNDRDASESRIQDRGVGFVFQHYALFKHMRVMDNIAFGLRARRKNKPKESETRRRVLELLDLVQLSGLERRFPAQLSGGQRQRVALARALAIEPSVLLLDEPSAHLTPACARICAGGCARSTTGPATQRCSSRTTRKKRSNWLTVSSS